MLYACCRHLEATLATWRTLFGFTEFVQFRGTMAIRTTLRKSAGQDPNWAIPDENAPVNPGFSSFAVSAAAVCKSEESQSAITPRLPDRTPAQLQPGPHSRDRKVQIT